MGSDWYFFTTTAAAAIPVPKEALLQPFHLPGFKLMVVRYAKYHSGCGEYLHEYHGALICLENTTLPPGWMDVIGPYQIARHRARCMRVKHLDEFMPAETRDRLVNAFETYTGRKPDVVPAFWVVSASSEYSVELELTWSLGEDDTIVGTEHDDFQFSVVQDAHDDDDSDACIQKFLDDVKVASMRICGTQVQIPSQPISQHHIAASHHVSTSI